MAPLATASSARLVIDVQKAFDDIAAAGNSRPKRPGSATRDEARGAPGEPVVLEHGDGAFIGTDLERLVRDRGVRAPVIVGAATDPRAATPTRVAGNPGFDANPVRDAASTFDRIRPDGDEHTADERQAMTLANRSGEGARIVAAAGIERVGAR
jgi:nicotinamidase-related amidase